jgi:hypothetical protein
MEASRLQDCAALAKAFQKKMMSAADESDVIGSLLPAVSMIQVNAASASGNLLNAISPPIPDLILDALAEASEAGPKVELPNNPSIQNAASLTALGIEWLEKCIPCNLRLKFKADLYISLSDTLVLNLEEMLNNYIKELNFIISLLNSTDIYQDGCLMLKVLADICVPDIQRMISLFAALLYRQTSREVLEQTDIMKLLIMPIFQPIFTNITQVFGQYKVLVTDPLQCVVANLSYQIERLKTGGFLTDPQVNNIESKTNLLMEIAGIGPTKTFPIDFSSDDVKDSLVAAQTVGNSLDQGLSAIQNSLGSSIFELKRLTSVGIVEVETILADLERELSKFIGGSQSETNTFLIRQYDKLIIVRMIAFLIAVVKAVGSGFDCNLPAGETGNSVLNKFYEDFLGPSSRVVVSRNPATNEVTLVLDSKAQPLIENTKEDSTRNPPAIILDPTGNNEVDQAVNAIMNKVVTPVTIKPKCFFDTQTPDDNRLAQFLAQLDATEV